jgi:hypothetical protein
MDYSGVRGFCYFFTDKLAIDKVRIQFSWAQRLRLNSMRFLLQYQEWKTDPSRFLDKLVTFVRTAADFGINSMPILLNGNMLDPAILESDFHESGNAYISAVVNALKGEKGLFIWDVMNEPSCNDYILKADSSVLQERYAKIWAFVKYYCNLTHEFDSGHPITVGHTFSRDIEPTVNEVGIISFHDYLPTRKLIQATYDEAISLGKKYNKPLINSEMACLCRANPYDLALEICEKNHVGWYIFELMIDSYWSDVHGIFYPDGSIRDPSIVAAIMGFHRNRSNSAIKAHANREGHALKAIQKVKEALDEGVEVFTIKRKTVEEILEAAEYCANLLEACELVPMWDPPTAKIGRLRAQTNPDPMAARKLAFDLAELLRTHCQLLP